MSDAFTQFDAIEEVVIPAIEEKVYDKFWLYKMEIVSQTTTSAKCNAWFAYCRDTAEGKELKPIFNETDLVKISIDNLFIEAQSNVLFAQAMEMVFVALKAYGVANNIFKGEETPEVVE